MLGEFLSLLAGLLSCSQFSVSAARHDQGNQLWRRAPGDPPGWSQFVCGNNSEERRLQGSMAFNALIS